MQLTFEWEGVTYIYDPEELDYPITKAIKDQLGFGQRSWQRALDDLDPDAVNALFFAIRKQNGHIVNSINECQVPTIKFSNAFTRAYNESYKAQVESKAEKAIADRMNNSDGPHQTTNTQTQMLANSETDISSNLPTTAT